MANSDDIKVKKLDSWKEGTISAFAKSRVPERALVEAYNVYFNANGTVASRGSFERCMVADSPGYPVGSDFIYRRTDGTMGLMLMNRFHAGSAFIRTLDSSKRNWIEPANEVSFSDDTVPSYTQIANKIVIADGVNPLAYYDIPTNRIHKAVKIKDPVNAPGVILNGASGTNVIDYFYRVAITTSWGTTIMCPPTKVSSPKLREDWGSKYSVSIDVDKILDEYNSEPNATGWNLYMASVSTGTGIPTDSEYLLIDSGLGMAQRNYTDKGTKKVLASAPVENSTGGIIARYVKNISGRLWALGVNNKVYWGGDGEHCLYFGTANGAGSNSLDKDGIQKPIAIGLGRDNAGTSCINLHTDVSAGTGHIWDIYATTNTINSGDQTYTTGTYQFKQREGRDGTCAPFSFIQEENNSYYMTVVGAKSTGVKPNVTGIQSTDIISSAVRDRFASLITNNLKDCYGTYFDNCLYWTLSHGDSSTNNEIWVYDLLHGGIWSIWTVEAHTIFTWASSDNEIPSLYIRQGAKLLKYNKNSYNHADNGKPFLSKISSGYITIQDDFVTWVYLLKIIWFFDVLVGRVKLAVNIHNDKYWLPPKVVELKNELIDTSDIGWGNIFYGANNELVGTWNSMDWNDELSPLQGSVRNDKLDLFLKVSQNINTKIDYISFSIEIDSMGSAFELSRLDLLYTYIGNGIEFLNQKYVQKA